ncbi:MAG: hypothetical protein ACFBSE_07655 [Prochloraceae cyanobacterium]
MLFKKKLPNRTAIGLIKRDIIYFSSGITRKILHSIAANIDRKTVPKPPKIAVKRLKENPIIYPEMDEKIGNNINGPSLIKVPEWVENPLGKYYLYFAHHQGSYIRLAYANNIAGPWKIYDRGVLNLQQSYFKDHVASPDLKIMSDRREIWLYYHGCTHGKPQMTRMAISRDGLNFTANPEILGKPYWRIFEWDNYYYILEKPGQFLRSKTGCKDFESGPNISLYLPNMRHAAVRVRDNMLDIFYSEIRGRPEQILLSTIKLTPDWKEWIPSQPVTVLKPETDYEGANYPILASKTGMSRQPVCQLRDPGIFEENGKTYLFYSVAGENGIAIAEITIES